MTDQHAVILFPTSAHVMRAEKLMKRAGFFSRLIPVPRHLSSDCGVCLQVLRQDASGVRRILDDGRVDFDEII